MTSVVLDTEVLLALWDPYHGQHLQARTVVGRYVVDGTQLIMPVSVFSETLIGAFRATPYALRTIEGFIDELVHFVHPVDRTVGRAAARLRADHDELPLDLALVIATGDAVAAGEIVTTDSRLAGLDQRVRLLGG